MAGMCAYSLFYVLGSGAIVFGILGIFAYQNNAVVLMENLRFDDQNLVIEEPGIKQRVTKQYLVAALIDLVLAMFLGIKIGRDRKESVAASTQEKKALDKKNPKSKKNDAKLKDYLQPLMDKEGNINNGNEMSSNIINTNSDGLGLGLGIEEGSSEHNMEDFNLTEPIN